MPLANATTKLAASGAAPTAARPLTAWRASNAPLPAMMIAASKKLNSAAAPGARPRHGDALMVDPEPETPGRIPTAWARPMPRGSPGVIPAARAGDPRVDPDAAPA